MPTIRSKRLDDVPAKEVRESWTQERRDAAIPQPMPAVGPNPPPPAEDEPAGEPGTVGGQPASKPPRT